MQFENGAISIPNPFVEELVNAPHGEVHSEPADGALFQWQIGLRDCSLTRVKGNTSVFNRECQGSLVDISTQFQRSLETCLDIPVDDNIGSYLVNGKTQAVGYSFVQAGCSGCRQHEFSDSPQRVQRCRDGRGFHP